MFASIEKTMYITIGQVTFEVRRQFLGRPPHGELCFEACATKLPADDSTEKFEHAKFVTALWPNKALEDFAKVEAYMNGYMFLTADDLCKRHFRELAKGHAKAKLRRL